MTSSPHLAGLKGSTDWSVPADWRQVNVKFEAAMDIVEYCYEQPSRLETMRVADLGDVISAIELIRAIPEAMRGTRTKQLVDTARKREVKSVSYRPTKLGLASMLVNPISAVAGFGIGVAARKIGRNVMANTVISEDEWLSSALTEIELLAIDLQISAVLAHSATFPRDDEFDRELGRRIYWVSFFYPRRRDEIPSNLSLDAATANSSVAESQRNLESLRNSMSLLIGSPFQPGLTEMDTIQRKIKKGKRVPEMEKAWEWRCESLAIRQRHLMPYANRMEWTVG